MSDLAEDKMYMCFFCVLVLCEVEMSCYVGLIFLVLVLCEDVLLCMG